MKLKLSYPTKEGIPEGAESFYTESGGAWKLNVDGDIKTQSDIDRVKAALEKERELKVEAEKEVAKYKDVDLEKWEKVKDIDPDRKKSSGDKTEDEIRKDLSEEYREKERKLQEKYEQKESEYKSQVDDANSKAKNYVKDSWKRKLLSEKYNFTDPRRLNDFLRAAKDDSDPDFAPVRKALASIEVTEENGTFKVVGGDLKDEKGAMEILEAVATHDLAKHYRPAPDNTGGGSGNKSDGDGGVNNPFKKDKEGNYNRTEAGNVMRQGKDKARQLAKQAGWAEKEITW